MGSLVELSRKVESAIQTCATMVIAVSDCCDFVGMEQYFEVSCLEEFEG